MPSRTSWSRSSTTPRHLEHNLDETRVRIIGQFGGDQPAHCDHLGPGQVPLAQARCRAGETGTRQRDYSGPLYGTTGRVSRGHTKPAKSYRFTGVFPADY